MVSVALTSCSAPREEIAPGPTVTNSVAAAAITTGLASTSSLIATTTTNDTQTTADMATTVPSYDPEESSTQPDTVPPTASVSTASAPADFLLLSYSWKERSENVRSLQLVLGVVADAWYGEQTREAHLRRLDELGLSVGGVPQPATAETPSFGQACSSEDLASFAYELLNSYGIPIPSFVATPGRQRPAYRPATGVIVYEGCLTATEIAHEVGHYVMDYANGMNFSAHVDEVAAHFTGASWVKGEELYPGVEYAAHCVGNVLWGYGSYTKCPDSAMRDYAASVLGRASS